MERNTHQKKVVMDALEELKGWHPSADEVYERVLKKVPSISRATVYRILNQIAEQGGVLRLKVPSTADRYDDCIENHYHMRCTGCGKVIDVDVPYMEDLCEKAPKSDKYVITGHDIIFSGLCLECATKSE